MIMVKHVFVLGADDRNLETLHESSVLQDCQFHPLLDVDDLIHTESIDIAGLLNTAERQLDAEHHPPDAIIGYWDFPVTSMVPILCSRRGLPSADLTAVVKCEHKYWSRLEQAKAISEVPRFGLVRPELDRAPPADVPYPLWIKPVKSFSSQLAFRVNDDAEFRDALASIREGIDRVGEPFDAVLHHLSGLPGEIENAGGQACIAEQAVSGQQVTVEGYRHHGRTHIYGIIDSATYPDSPSFLRYQYPSSLPGQVRSRITGSARRVIAGIGLENVPFNIEYFWDSDRDTLWLLEINPRHSQSHAPLFAAVDGEPNHICMVQLALGRDPDFPYRQGNYGVAAKWFYRRFTDATVSRVPTPEQVAAVERAHPGTLISIRAADGVRLSELPDQDSYSYELAHLYIGAADDAEMYEKYQRCLRDLPFDFDET